MVVLVPKSGFFLCSGVSTSCCCAGASCMVSRTGAGASATAVCRGATGSMIFLLMVHSLSHSCVRLKHALVCRG